MDIFEITRFTIPILSVEIVPIIAFLFSGDYRDLDIFRQFFNIDISKIRIFDSLVRTFKYIDTWLKRGYETELYDRKDTGMV